MANTQLEKFTHIREPYGTLILKDCTVEPHADYPDRYTVTGTVVEGGTVSRLLQHSRFDSEVGNRHVVWYVTPAELSMRVKRTISCG